MVANKLSSPDSSSTWTAKKTKLFENALGIYDQETSDRCHKIAKIVGGTTEEEVKRQYEILVHDINCRRKQHQQSGKEAQEFKAIKTLSGIGYSTKPPISS